MIHIDNCGIIPCCAECPGGGCVIPEALADIHGTGTLSVL